MPFISANLLILLIFLASPSHGEETQDSGKPLPERVLPRKNTANEAAITAFLKNNQREKEAIRLQVQGSSFTALYLNEQIGKPQGTVLILPDLEQHAQWPNLIAPLREYLPAYGWNTLSLGLPSAPNRNLPAREDSIALPAADAPAQDKTTEVAADKTRTQAADTEPSAGVSAQGTPKTDNAAGEPSLPRLEKLPELPKDEKLGQQTVQAQRDAALEYQEQMLGRLKAAVAYLQQQGQFNIALVASGENATWAALYLAAQPVKEKLGQEKNKEGLALILVDATGDAYAPEPLNQILPRLKLPILDIMTPFNRNSAFNNNERIGAIRHSKNADYTPVKLEALALEENYGNLVTRRIRGWLGRHLAGNEKKMAEAN
ncbi:MAG: hypothetical protein RL217_1385 [Pseudomonadota bacterium]